MTLSTKIRIVEPTPVRPIFEECRRLLGAENAEFEDKVNSYGPLNRCISNHLGQGYAAWLLVTYGADGPIREYEEVVNDPDQADDDHVYHPAASIEVDFDTAYGYRSTNGAGCADLHAWLIVELGRWLNQRCLTWYWENEFTGEWHRGLDDQAALLAFGNPASGALLESV